jgi:hypothetical protein
MSGVQNQKPLRARWWFAAAFALLVLGFFVLPSPYAGIASILCVGAFITAATRVIRNADPETSRGATRAGIPGDMGGGGF